MSIPRQLYDVVVVIAIAFLLAATVIQAREITEMKRQAGRLELLKYVVFEFKNLETEHYVELRAKCYDLSEQDKKLVSQIKDLRMWGR